MKLELKHIAAYLPYELKAFMLDYEIDYVGKKTDVIKGLYQWDKSGKLWCCLTEGGSKPSIDRVKPILRSLDAMTEREKILVELSFVEATPVESIPDMDFPDPWKHDIAMYEWLLANHFDIFGLIKQGLAVEKGVSHD